MLKNFKEKKFRLQIMQDVLSAYYNTPLRVFKKDAISLAYNIITKSDETILSNKNINNQEDFKEFLISTIDNIPDLTKNLDNYQLPKIFFDIPLKLSKKITREIFITYSSFYSKLYRKLKHTQSFLNYSIFITLYMSATINKSNDFSKNFEFNIFECNNTIVAIGPFCKNEKIEIFINNIIKIFKIPSHYYELEILYEKNIEKSYNSLIQIKNIFLNHLLAFDKIDTNYTLSQAEIKKLAFFAIYNEENKPDSSVIQFSNNTHLQYKNNNYEYLYQNRIINQRDSILDEIEKKYLNSIDKFNIESFNSIGDQLFDKFIPLVDSYDDKQKFIDGILKVLKRLIYADAVLFYNYIEHNKTFELLEQYGLNEKEHTNVTEALKKINEDPTYRKQSLTQKIIDNYYNNNDIILLENGVNRTTMVQPFNKKKIHSVLSLPLIYDNKIRGILHFFSYRPKAFSESNKKFLLQFSNFLSHLMVNSIFLKLQSDIIALMNKDDFNRDNQSKDLKNIASLIADIFSSDGAMIFLHSKDIIDRATEREHIHLKATKGFKFYGKDENMAIKEKESFLQNEHFKEGEFLVVRDFNLVNKSQMKYYELFQKNKIKSFLVIKILDKSKKLEGAIVVFDRVNRECNPLTKRMLKIVAQEIRLLNILNRHTYQQQLDREKILHESKQTFISLNKEVKRLDMRLKSNKISFTNAIDKKNIFKNLEDIKHSAKISINFLTNFLHNRVLDYDRNIISDIDNINKCIDSDISEYISIGEIVLKELHSKGIYGKTTFFIPYNYKVKLPATILSQIFSNIIGNAVKYSPKTKENRFYISYEIDSKYLNIFIDNTGAKILKEEKYRIFNKGFRGRQIVADEEHNKEWKVGENENQGLGCYYIKEVVTKSNWNGNFLFEELKSIDEKVSKNRFILKFPKNLLRGVK